MLYRKVPKTGEELSILGFGYMRLPQKPGFGIDEDRAIRQLRIAIDNGVNYVDTAPDYHLGRSEAVLGKALKDGYRGRVNIATKLPHWSVRTRGDMDRILSTQLATIGTDHVDYYLLHSLAREPWEKMEGLGVADFLDRAKGDGRIRNAGFSFHGDRETFSRIVDAYDWEFCQIQYNYLDENVQAGTAGLRYAAGRRLAVMVMEPLRGGNLARKVPPAVQKIWDESPEQRSPAVWGLSWVWNHPEVTVALSGMNEEADIMENITAASAAVPGSFPDRDLALVARVKDKYLQLMKVACTGCRYCMPCPAGVAIPECFALYNAAGLFPGSEAAFQYLGRHGGIIADPSYAGLCTRCGRCEALCPQHIPVREKLAEVSGEMEGRGFRYKIRAARAAFRMYDGFRRIVRRRSDRKPD